MVCAVANSPLYLAKPHLFFTTTKYILFFRHSFVCKLMLTKTNYMIFLTTYATHITFSDILINFIVWGTVIVLYRNRKKSEKDAKAWDVVATIFGTILLVMGANYAKKKVKDWWNKD